MHLFDKRFMFLIFIKNSWKSERKVDTLRRAARRKQIGYF